MKFDSNYRNSQRSDYEQFAKFLSGRQSAREYTPQAHSVPSQEATVCNHRPIAMVYGECQGWKDLFDIEIGLSKGTIFEELDLPLYKTACLGGQRGCRGL